MAAASGKTAAHKLFEHAAIYAKYRPTYPASIFAKIASLVSEGVSKPTLAVDVATGTGQALQGLSGHFPKVIAVEASSAQCKQASERAGIIEGDVEVHEGFAETFVKDCSLTPGSADAVTVFQAAHWFKLDGANGFFAQAATALRPGGLVALIGYGNCSVRVADGSGDKPTEAAEIIDEFYNGLLGEYWDDRRRLVDAHYVGMEPADSTADSSSPWNKVWRDDSEAIERRMPLDAFVGYLGSWSAYQTYRAKHSTEADPLLQVRTDLEAVLGDGELIVSWPLFCVFAESRRR